MVGLKSPYYWSQKPIWLFTKTIIVILKGQYGWPKRQCFATKTIKKLALKAHVVGHKDHKGLYQKLI